VNLWQDLWASFKAVFGPVATIAALMLAIWGGLYPPAATVQIRVIWIVVAVIIVSMVLLVSWNMTMMARAQARDRLPRTRAARVSGDAEPGTADLTLLLDRSDWFGTGLAVSIYFFEEIQDGSGLGFERLIGLGKVDSVQESGRIQVLVVRELEGYAELWQRIRRQDAATIARVVVKPSVPYHEAGVEVRSNE
jgi:hypothetical protein